MHNTKNIREFIRYNDKELRYIAASICKKYNVSCIDDIVQEVYLKILTADILERYNPNYNLSRPLCSQPKFSTFLFSIIRNIVRSFVKSGEYFIESRRYSLAEFDSQDEMNDVELALRYENFAFEYKELINKDNIPGSVDCLSFELEDFEKNYFPKVNKKFTLEKRKNKDVYTDGCSLLKVYTYLKEGLLNQEIAEIHGTTNMFVSFMKKDISIAMKNYGFNWKPGKRIKKLKKRRKKRIPRNGNGQRALKKRNLSEQEKYAIKQRFIKTGGILPDGWCSSVAKNLNLSVRQVQGYITSLHNEIKKREIKIKKPVSYHNYMEEKRNKWCDYKSPKYSKLRKKRRKARKGPSFLNMP